MNDTTTASTGTPQAGPDITLAWDGHVAVVEIHRPPHNFFDLELIRGLGDVFDRLGADPQCRAIVLAAEGTSFCAGANFDATRQKALAGAERPAGTNPLYVEGLRLFAGTKPVVAAVHGAAVGGGLGLALVADFRVTCAEARFSANFNRLGFHPGFGLSVTLPRLIGAQRAALLLFTGRRVGGEEAVAMGLADELVPRDAVRSRAIALAQDIATSAPIAVQSTRITLRQGLVASIAAAVDHEGTQQAAHYKTADFREGVAAMAARRTPVFTGS